MHNDESDRWLWLDAAIIVAMVMAVAGCGSHGFFGLFGGHAGPKVPTPPPAPTPGAGTSWATLKQMALIAFVPGIGMLIASTLGAIWFPPLALLRTTATQLIGAAIVIAGAPFVIEWVAAEAETPVKVGIWIALGLLVAWTIWRMWLARKAHKTDDPHLKARLKKIIPTPRLSRRKAVQCSSSSSSEPAATSPEP